MYWTCRLNEWNPSEQVYSSNVREQEKQEGCCVRLKQISKASKHDAEFYHQVPPFHLLNETPLPTAADTTFLLLLMLRGHCSAPWKDNVHYRFHKSWYEWIRFQSSAGTIMNAPVVLALALLSTTASLIVEEQHFQSKMYEQRHEMTK
jgi:hypothetical protein